MGLRTVFTLLQSYKRRRDRIDMADTAVMRVPAGLQAEARSLASLRGRQPAELVAQAWQEFLERHGEEFARDLEYVAKTLRDGTLEDLTAFINRGNAERAKDAARKAREGT
jgi:hypothetical protein